MSETDETENGKAPWTIKGVLVSDRKLAIDTANKAGQSVAQCMGEAMRHWANLQAGNVVSPSTENRANQGQPTINLGDMALMLQAVTAAAASAGIPVQKRVVRGVFAVLDGQLRAANGLPALAPRKPSVRQITMDGLPKNRPSLPMGKPQ